MQMVIVIAIALVVLYFGAFYASAGADESATETEAPLRVVKVFRNFFVSIFIFFALDAAIFHSGLYESVLKPDSYAGRASRALREEKQRKASRLKEILLVGDSRIARGFSEGIANKTAAGRGVRFIKRVVPGSSPRTWYYLLREVDPLATRYQAVVMPLKIDSWTQNSDGIQDIFTDAPLLRYSDAWSFASSFRKWNNQCRAFSACVLRGSAFQSDIVDFLEQPLQRIRELRGESAPPKLGGQDQQRDNVDLAGKDPDQTAKFQRKSVTRARQLDPSSSNPFQWTDKISKRYASSRTSVVIVRFPVNPLGPAVKNSWLERVDKPLDGNRLIILEEYQFEFLESPEYFADAFHLNAKGVRLFTERLSQELLARWGSAEANREQRDAPDGLSER